MEPEGDVVKRLEEKQEEKQEELRDAPNKLENKMRDFLKTLDATRWSYNYFIQGRAADEARIRLLNGCDDRCPTCGALGVDVTCFTDVCYKYACSANPSHRWMSGRYREDLLGE